MASHELPIPRHSNGPRLEHGNYQLPPLIGVTREGMVSSFGSIAVVATLLAVTETIFLLLLKMPNQTSSDIPGSQLQRTLSALTYTGIVLNLGSLWSALRMIDVLGKMPLLNARYEADLDAKRLSLRLTNDTSTHDVMASYGLRGIWTFMAWHCLISLLFGSLCIVTQIAMFVWLYEALAVSISITVLVVFASVPMLLSFFM
ncbi:hypothetical protein M407DRAFT_246519 [Tulasnella calospora MUT 4182]|uniref:Uncharacterized protein n=1 Tax=Tulasnella calospora MUT 4182 TaxID=1051891 RepID=A0A0C3L9X9_9AGAM|nr:hypothetical protein M407DRAFT_246519 [Tulasnella calospora MUT 4182]